MFSQCHIHILLDLYLSFPKLLQMVRFSSVDHVQLCDPMDCSTPGLPVHHQVPELVQTHVSWVSDAIQPFCPLSSPSLPAFYLPSWKALFHWVGSSHQVAKVLELQLQHQSFQWYSGLISFRMDWFASKNQTKSVPLAVLPNIALTK